MRDFGAFKVFISKRRCMSWEKRHQFLTFFVAHSAIAYLVRKQDLFPARHINVFKGWL